MKTNYVGKVVEAVQQDGVIKATKYVGLRYIIRATRTNYGRKPRKNENVEITLTIGRPNYLEREFIRECVKAKEPFPVKKIQLKYFNPKKKKLKRS